MRILDYKGPCYATNSIAKHFSGDRETAIVLDVACGTGEVAKEVKQSYCCDIVTRKSWQRAIGIINLHERCVYLPNTTVSNCLLPTDEKARFQPLCGYWRKQVYDGGGQEDGTVPRPKTLCSRRRRATRRKRCSFFVICTYVCVYTMPMSYASSH